ncbi:hypothetical protein GCM10008024_21370 [Allgaiera indica]|uniref:Uncharacterized protein n=1 Tax=Allgaiera indica TaxID=765699 RepID=A0AAN4USI0_9RHOB|nr:hypothetical protein [Allgaiera indica]GHE02333.1 hypothetical protein GCM10008024_21370 [Allgaiera indica]SDX31461.1 hypothetical protein SAMN05444006_113120 [Allgaiera indica]
MKHDAASRKAIVQHFSVERIPKGDILFPSFTFKGQDDPDEVWVVLATTRLGMMPEQTNHHVFRNEAEAKDFMRDFPIGSEVPEPDWGGSGPYASDFVRKIVDEGGPTLGAADEDSFLPLRILDDAGFITGKAGSISEKVAEFIGRERIQEIKDRHGDFWQVAADFEYCWQNTSHSSAVFVAASFRFHRFVTGNEFAAGYLLRDLEMLVDGVEAEATSSVERRRKATTRSGEKSKESRMKRINALLDRMTEIVESNPIAARFDPEAVAKMAGEDCAVAQPKLWQQGKRQISEYLGEIRRGEAGGELKARYYRLFAAKQPERP